MGVKIRIQNSIIQLVVMSDGVRHQVSTGLHLTGIKQQDAEVMRLAEILRSKKEIQLVERMNGINTAESKMTLYAYVSKCGDEKGHESQFYKALPYIEKFGGREVRISSITPLWFENFQKRMEKDSGLKPATAEKYCCIVRQCLKKAVRDGALHNDPASGIKHIRVPESERPYLTAREVQRLASTPYKMPYTDESLQDEIRRGFLFAICTGLRISDIQLLQWRHVDLETKQLAKVQKKTRRAVYVPLKDEALPLMGDAGAPDDFVFPILAKTRTSTNRYISAWAEAAGITKHVTWHIGRHTDATLLLEYGADLYTVQRLLGHTKIATTAKYAKVTDKKSREAVAALPDFGIAETV